MLGTCQGWLICGTLWYARPQHWRHTTKITPALSNVSFLTTPSLTVLNFNTSTLLFSCGILPAISPGDGAGIAEHQAGTLHAAELQASLSGPLPAGLLPLPQQETCQTVFTADWEQGIVVSQHVGVRLDCLLISSQLFLFPQNVYMCLPVCLTIAPTLPLCMISSE